MQTPIAAPKTSGPLLHVPLVLAVVVLAFLLTGRVQQSDHMFWAFAGVGTALVVWHFAIRGAARRLGVIPVKPVKQHYIQSCVQVALYAYWGYLWVVDGARPIYVQVPLVFAQLCFLFSFDALWSWTRGRPWRLASGPAPIVLSTNLFIWFKDDWFIWQFAMLIAGLLGKEFIRWQKEGRSAHVFNPSGFGLMCAATVLILLDATDLTWAKPLASEIEVEQIYVVLFALGLVVQFFFAVTLMTFAAALAMIACNLLYTELTGVYLFASSNLPAAAFLGLMLLMTDPSTSPRTNVGRTLFGFGYGIGYVVAFHVLGSLGAPELYAKLYPVPILNCTVQALDRFARWGPVGRLNERWQNGVSLRVSNGVHMGLWSAVFIAMLVTGYVQAVHPGNSIVFWKRAVAEQRHDAARKLVMVTGSQAVASGTPQANRAAALNELGILSLTADVDDSSWQARVSSAARWFAQGAELGSDEASINLLQLFLFHRARRSDQDLGKALQRAQQLGVAGNTHAAFLIGLAVETGVGVEPDARGALSFYRRLDADDPLRAKALARIALSGKVTVDLSPAAPILLARADDDGEAAYYVSFLQAAGRGGIAKDREAAQATLARAAALGFEPAADAAGQGPMKFVTPRRMFLSHPAWATRYPVGEQVQ